MSDSAGLLARAWQSYQAHQFDEAERTCLQILHQDAGHVEALHLLALCHFQLALAHDALGQWDQAIASYRRTIELQPDFSQAYNNLGSVLQRCGRLDEAVTYLQTAVALRPNYIKAYLNLGAIWTAQGKLDEAVDCYRWLLQLEPDSPEVYCNLGVTLENQGKFAEAAASYQAALRLQPELVEAIFNLGNVHRELDQLDEAAALYLQTLALQPEHVQAHNNLGTVRNRQGRRREAMQHYQAALELSPQDADAWTNLGAAWTDEGEWDEALRCHEQALRLRPGHAGAHCNIGLVLHRRGQLAEALAWYEEALRRAPECADAHWNRSLIWLVQGNFAQGWPAYEWRWRSQGKLLPFPQPRWDGSDLAGRTILLHTEQGLGDALQFIRYAPLVKRRGGTVVVYCRTPLKRVFAGCPGIDVLVAQGEPLPPFDVHAPLLSLPGIFGTTIDTIPADVPYLHAEPELVEYWRQQLGARPGYRVGLVWQGSVGHIGDRQRSLSLAQLAPLVEVPGIAWYSLQVGPGSEQLITAGLPVADLGNRFDPSSLADLAAVLVNLDLLISVDTAPVHLAGALGVPVWVMLPHSPDWRWLLDRSDSPWYPTMRLFRQPRLGDWNTVLGQIALALGKPSIDHG